VSLIFSKFPSMAQARAFQKEVKKRFGLNGRVFSSDEEAYKHDCFPWVLTPPIVHIERVPDIEGAKQIAAIKRRFNLTDKEVKACDHYSAEVETAVNAEKRVEDLVEQFGGRFSGT
jgi:hypothetical protein